MAKFNAKNLAIIIVFGIFLLGTVVIVNAQQLLPEGGDSFGAAVKLEPGSYEGGAMEKDQVEYFYINLKPGQELQIKGTLKALPDSWGEGEVALYNEERQKLVGVSKTFDKGEKAEFSFSWLSNSDKDLYKYYIKRECTWHKLAPFPLDISLIDHYDIGSQTDAGDSFEKAINITLGEHNGYLSGASGADTKDFYKLAAKKGKTLTIRTTPEGEARMKVAVYNNDRQIIKEEYAPNPGAIVTNSVSITKSEDVFIAIVCDEYCNEDITAYTLNIATEKTSDEEVGLPQGESMYPQGTEEAAKAISKGIAWIIISWIVGPIVFLIIIGMIIYFLWKKKK